MFVRASRSRMSSFVSVLNFSASKFHNSRILFSMQPNGSRLTRLQNINDGKSTLGLKGRYSGFDSGRPRCTSFVLFCSAGLLVDVISISLSCVLSMLRRRLASSTVNSAMFGIRKQTSLQPSSVPLLCSALTLLISALIFAN